MYVQRNCFIATLDETFFLLFQVEIWPSNETNWGWQIKGVFISRREQLCESTKETEETESCVCEEVGKRKKRDSLAFKRNKGEPPLKCEVNKIHPN